MIPYARQTLDAQDIREVTRVLRSAWLTQGPMVAKFEEAFAKYCGARYAVAVSSGTAGLHLAALAAGLQTGDEAVTTPLSFVATSNAVLYCGAKPVFADIDANSLGLDPEKAKAKVGPRTRAVLNVHFAGQPNVLAPKRYFSKRTDFTRIDDVCHALGAEVKAGAQWKKVGSLNETDMSVFSFHPVKHITTGEGGIVTTHRKELYEKLLLLRSHGIERDPARFRDRKSRKGPWYYEMQTLGFNYRITDIQCALGLSQLRKIGANVARRREIAAFYDEAFSNIQALRSPARIEGTRSSYHLYVLRVDFRSAGISRARFTELLRKEGVATQVHYIPITKQPFYVENELSSPMPLAEAFYEEALSIPMFAALKDREAVKVAKAVKKIFKKGSVHVA